MKQNNTWISICLLMLLAACQSSGNSAHTHSHGEDAHSHGTTAHEEHSKEHISLYSKQTELYAEFPAIMPAHTTTFLVHLTNLETYKPYKKGKLTISLIKGTKGIRATTTTPEKEGVFVVNLQAKEAGSYSLVFDFESENGMERFTANNIRVYKDHEEAEKATALRTEDENTIHFLKEQAWEIDFGISEVKKGHFQEIIKTTGSLQPSATMEQQVVAQSSGIVHFYSSDIVPGKEVEKNDPLFILSGKGLAGDNISVLFVEAETELEQAKTAFERAKALQEDQIVSEKDFLKAKARFETAKAKFNSINQHFSARGLHVNSPVSGFVCDIYVKEGQFVEKGTPLIKVDKGSKLLLKADVYQKHLQQLRSIRSANFKLPYRDKIYDTKELNGKLIAYGKDIHEEDYTTPLYFQIDFSPDLYAGSFVEVFLKSETTRKVVFIEKSAILEDQGIKYVFVQTGGESFAKRFVSVGSDNGKQVEIIAGLQPGERVVSKGSYFVKLASLAGALPAHSHEH